MLTEVWKFKDRCSLKYLISLIIGGAILIFLFNYIIIQIIFHKKVKI